MMRGRGVKTKPSEQMSDEKDKMSKYQKKMSPKHDGDVVIVLRFTCSRLVREPESKKLEDKFQHFFHFDNGTFLKGHKGHRD